MLTNRIDIFQLFLIELSETFNKVDCSLLLETFPILLLLLLPIFINVPWETHPFPSFQPLNIRITQISDLGSLLSSQNILTQSKLPHFCIFKPYLYAHDFYGPLKPGLLVKSLNNHKWEVSMSYDTDSKEVKLPAQENSSVASTEEFKS